MEATLRELVVRVGLVVNGFPIVSETFIYNQAAGLQAKGFTVTVITAADHGDPELFATRELRFTGEVRRAVLGGSPFGMLGRIAANLKNRSMRALVDSHRLFGNGRRSLRAWMLALPLLDQDVIHVEYSGLAVSWLDALKLVAPTRLVVSCRGTAERITPHADPRRGEMLREVFALADRVHCVSEDIVRGCAAFGLEPTKAFVNRPAIDARQFMRSSAYAMHSSGPFRLISTGRLVWAKGLEFALIAVQRLRERGINVTYTIVGAGPDEERLRFAIHDLGLHDHVTLRGRMAAADVRRELEASDVYLLPSVSEGISNAALEAMAMEMPVVAARVGGLPEAIDDGVDGYLVPSRNPEALVDRIAQLLASPDVGARIGRAARARIERDFSLERQLKVFMAEYEALR